MPSAQELFDDREFQLGLAHAFEEFTLHHEEDVLAKGERVAETAKGLCPVSPVGGKEAPPGTLRDSIESHPGRDARGAFVDVGSKRREAPFVEYGTSRTRPEPFMRPALARMKRWRT